MPDMRIVIAAGGTGGHIYPALAIANQLKSSYGAQILFIGTPRGLESRLVPQAGYSLSLMAVAILARIPTLAVEPNAFPGLANRLVGKRVTSAAINFPAAAKYFRNPQVTGIPVRADFFRLQPRPVGAPPH